MNWKAIQVLLGIPATVFVLLVFLLGGSDSEYKTEEMFSPAETNTAAEEKGLPVSIETDPEKFVYTVSRVVDGDTLVVEKGGVTERVRLIGLDTPETVHPSKKVECFGKEASAYAKELLFGNRIHLETDPTQGERDVYGRLLAYVFLPDGTLFNKRMIAEGYGFEYTFSVPYKYKTEFDAAERDAKQSEKGLWARGACEDFE